MNSLRSISSNSFRFLRCNSYNRFQSQRFSAFHRTMASEFKLKGLSSVDLKNGGKQEVEVEGVEKGKVLLVKVNNEVHALSTNCTHYGAPLRNGVVNAAGRITCPWHGGIETPYNSDK
jgi:nitrite reductase/ring-hydroxylating ferredoxin subunit